MTARTDNGIEWVRLPSIGEGVKFCENRTDDFTGRGVVTGQAVLNFDDGPVVVVIIQVSNPRDHNAENSVVRCAWAVEAVS